MQRPSGYNQPPPACAPLNQYQSAGNGWQQHPQYQQQQQQHQHQQQQQGYYQPVQESQMSPQSQINMQQQMQWVQSQHQHQQQQQWGGFSGKPQQHQHQHQHQQQQQQLHQQQQQHQPMERQPMMDPRMMNLPPEAVIALQHQRQASERQALMMHHHHHHHHQHQHQQQHHQHQQQHHHTHHHNYSQQVYTAQPQPALSASAQSFIPSSMRTNNEIPTQPIQPVPRSSYVPPSKRQGSSRTPPLVGKKLTGKISSNNRIDCEEVREYYGYDPILVPESCSEFDLREGLEVSFQICIMPEGATATHVTVTGDDERYMGVAKGGFIKCMEASRKYPSHEISIDEKYPAGSRISFKIRFEADGSLTGSEVIVLPVSLEDLSSHQKPENMEFETPTVRAPLPGQNPWELDIVFYHSFCWDGLCSAYALYSAAGDHRENITFIPIMIGLETLPKDIEGKNIAFVDVVPGSKLLHTLMHEKPQNQMLIIDHHKSNEAVLTESGDNEHVCFDLGHSAASMAWEFARNAVVLGNKSSEIKHDQIPLFLSLVGEVDLGRFGIDFPAPRLFAIGVELFSSHSLFSSSVSISLPRANAFTPALQSIHKLLQEVCFTWCFLY